MARTAKFACPCCGRKRIEKLGDYEICDVCGKPMLIKKGRFGNFLGCSGFPECTFTKPIVVEMPGSCPKCGSKNLDYLTRVIGYLKRVSSFAEPRQIEAQHRFYNPKNVPTE